ncbi:hypothetical protein Scep_007897 [Stephania cephalantha]|uniref:Uncharacterized protein n=1 Tax=Stephania cephalantha TaxID=152367 RepID=A0AAP0PP68_9MAGN
MNNYGSGISIRQRDASSFSVFRFNNEMLSRFPSLDSAMRRARLLLFLLKRRGKNDEIVVVAKLLVPDSTQRQIWGYVAVQRQIYDKRLSDRPSSQHKCILSFDLPDQAKPYHVSDMSLNRDKSATYNFLLTVQISDRPSLSLILECSVDGRVGVRDPSRRERRPKLNQGGAGKRSNGEKSEPGSSRAESGPQQWRRSRESSKWPANRGRMSVVVANGKRKCGLAAAESEPHGSVGKGRSGTKVTMRGGKDRANGAGRQSREEARDHAVSSACVAEGKMRAMSRGRRRRCDGRTTTTMVARLVLAGNVRGRRRKIRLARERGLGGWVYGFYPFV